MKKLILIAVSSGLCAFAQVQSVQLPPSLRSVQQASAPGQNATTPDLPTFDIEFPGGAPNELVEALNKELGGTLNAIIPTEYSDVQIPPFKMKQVNVAQVFNALSQASTKRVPYNLRSLPGGFGPGQYQEFVENYGFRTDGPITVRSVWAFHVERAPQLPQQEPSSDRTCRYFQLGPYLDSLKIEDITTAIQTGWKMLNVPDGPTLKFHPETRLLVAVGRPGELSMIDDVLRELGKVPAKAKRVNEVIINGAVNKAGSMALPTNNQKLTVLDAIGRAGGLASRANPDKIRFSRPGESERILKIDDLKHESDPSKMIFLEPGDVIDVADKLF